MNLIFKMLISMSKFNVNAYDKLEINTCHK